MPVYLVMREKASHEFGADTVYLPTLSVDGGGPVRTGVLNKHGDAIYRAAEPAGFVTRFKPRVRVKAICVPA